MIFFCSLDKLGLMIFLVAAKRALNGNNNTKAEKPKILMNLFIFYSGLNIKQRPLLQNLLPDSLGPSLNT